MIRFKEPTTLQEYDIEGKTKEISFNQGNTIDAEVLLHDPDHSDLLVEDGTTFMGVPNDLFEEI